MVIGLGILLSGCASMSPKEINPAEFQQNLPSDAQQKFQEVVNTAIDGDAVTWQSDEGDVTYTLTTNDTHVNAQGEPCRDYQFVMDKRYHRDQQTTGEVCRQRDGTWAN